MIKNTGIIAALGAMSGTSLDGVDAAIVYTDGVNIAEFGKTDYHAYTLTEARVLKNALGRWPHESLDETAQLIETIHTKVLSGFIGAELIGFHGQTLAHDPLNARTHQCGDGQVLADILNLPVVWDFRSADLKLGGQGAPLAPFYHFALAKWLKADAPINDLMMDRLGQPFDNAGAVAAKGIVNDQVIVEFLENSYFNRMPPKSLDRDAFTNLSLAVSNLTTSDAAATLTAAVAISVSKALRFCPITPTKILVSGGGRKNQTLMKMLAAKLDMPILPVEEVGLDGDMLEAQAFAFLAVRVVRGLPTSCEGTTGVRAAVSGGTISWPPERNGIIKVKMEK